MYIDLLSKDIKELEQNPIEKYTFIHNFIPHPYHKTRAKLLSQKALLVYSMTLILIAATFRLIPIVAPGVLGYASDIKVSELLSLTNRNREEAGLSSLVMNEELSRAAEKKAQDMFKNNYWAHVSPTGTQPWDFILAQKYDYSYAGENLAKNFDSSRDVVTAWMNSPSHKDNLLNKNYNEIGFAVVNGTLDGYKTTLVVQMFGKQRTLAHLATPEEEKKIIDNIANESSSIEVPSSATPSLISNFNKNGKVILDTLNPSQEASVLPAVDISYASKTVGIVFGCFVGGLLAIDYWYSRRKGIPKFTGHTLAHLAFLLFAILGMWLVVSPGRIL